MDHSAQDNYYHKMIEEVIDYAILMLDANGIIQNWNRGAQRIKGYTEQEIVGRHFHIFYPPEDQAAGLPERLLAEARLNGRAMHEGWRVRKDGTRFWGSIVITALHDESGAILGFSKVTRDLTERKAAEDKLLQNARQLEVQNRELQQFAYAAAHDMKEPLRKILFYYSAILAGGETLDADKQRAYLERSADAARRMQGLIDDLLTFTKVVDVVDSFQPVDLNGIAAEVLQFYQDTIDSISATVVVGDLPVLNGIPFQLRQLFLNLIGNSLKYRDSIRPLKIEISSTPPNGFRHISVKDNGIGFHQAHAGKIFQMFERLHGREKYAGTGIGLSICRKIMDIHNGQIMAHGQPGEGAVFDLYFP
ncbi:MAG TPA: PAS domain S-box protein [Puia sp.]|nr:PAS domain S-box protein [Puia sp.]